MHTKKKIIIGNNQCGVTFSTVETQRIFHNMIPTCQPGATKLRNSMKKANFERGSKKLLNDRIIMSFCWPCEIKSSLREMDGIKPRWRLIILKMSIDILTSLY